MAWATPRTAVTGEVTTAANLNEIRDNLLDLDRRTNAGLAEVATEESTGSTSYADLTTPGPAVVASVGVTGICVVCISCRINPPTDVQGIMSYAVSGATTISPQDSKALYVTKDSRVGVVNVQDGLTAGNNTFTAKYKTGTAATTVYFSQRTIVAVPLAR